jgi:hypothetical protein
MKIKQQFLLFFIIMLFISFCGCASKEQKPDPGTPDPELSSKPLEFFGCSFHDEEGFTFDGFPLMADYDILESRMALTETEVKPLIKEQELSRKKKGVIQIVEFYQIPVPGYSGAVGRVTYNFYEKENEILSVSIEDPEGKLSKTKGEQSYLAFYLDKRNVIIQMDAHVLDGETIEVGVNFSEHAWRSGIEMNDSIYFDFISKTVQVL